MQFSAVLLSALSAGAHALPTTDAILGGDINPNLNNFPHNAAIAIFSNSSCYGKETQTPISFATGQCYPFDSAFDTVGINWGSDVNCGLNVFTDSVCADYATTTLKGSVNGFTCFSMRANGGPWRSLAMDECWADDVQ